MTRSDLLRSTGHEILRRHALIERGEMIDVADVRGLMMKLATDCNAQLDQIEGADGIRREVLNVIGFSDLAEQSGMTAPKRLQYLACAYAGGIALAQIVAQPANFPL